MLLIVLKFNFFFPDNVALNSANVEKLRADCASFKAKSAQLTSTLHEVKKDRAEIRCELQKTKKQLENLNSVNAELLAKNNELQTQVGKSLFIFHV